MSDWSTPKVTIPYRSTYEAMKRYVRYFNA